MKNTFKIIAIAVVSSVATISAYQYFVSDNDPVILNEGQPIEMESRAKLINYANVPATVPGDFTSAASISAPAVVHIKATSTRAVRQRRPSMFDEFFGFDDDFFGGQGRSQKQQSSGSGVIITSDGYITTNNHVVDGADELEVITYDKKIYEAKVIGVDPSTDIAVIKIEEKNLPKLAFGNSDEVLVGEWVLAVGNPFNLASTVTAGIISAIGRDISILDRGYQQRYQNGQQGDTPIESFIQTDAAVNPGNSGGALVNLQGELIGINTAIASPNGAYAGYAFAVPSSMVKKVTADLIKYGNVQRGYLGIAPVELDMQNAEEYDVKITEGIYVQDAPEDGAAEMAGIESGDVIIMIDGIKTISEPKFRELIGRKRPGDRVKVTIDRDGTIKEYNVTLRNLAGGKSILKKETVKTEVAKLGLKIEELSEEEKEEIGLRNGVRVEKVLESGTIARDTDIKEGFIITRVGRVRVDSEEDFSTAIKEAVKNREDGVLICGVYKNVSRNFCYGLTL